LFEQLLYGSSISDRLGGSPGFVRCGCALRLSLQKLNAGTLNVSSKSTPMHSAEVVYWQQNSVFNWPHWQHTVKVTALSHRTKAIQ